MTTIALTGGGTAGHITPLLAVGAELRQLHPETTLCVVGSEAGRERELLPEGFGDIVEVPKLPFPRSINADMFRFPGRFFRAVRMLREEFRRREVDVVAGFGGYIAAPAYVAAWLEKIPLVIHEANRVPGLANRLGARLTAHVATCFPGTPLRGAREIGMPLPESLTRWNREELATQARDFFGVTQDRPIMLVTGGSSGAKKLNDAIFSRVERILERGWQIIHLIGPTLQAPARVAEGYFVMPYCRRMDLAYAVSDLVVSRAGAATVSELAVTGLPAVLVPYHVGNGEQEKNARYLVDAGAALTVAQKDFTETYIDSVLIPLLDDEAKRQEMASRAKELSVTDAAQVFASMVWAARKGKI